jgi:hypothetical protein
MRCAVSTVVTTLRDVKLTKPMRNISGSFRSTGVRLVNLGENRWRVELWDWNAGEGPPFATLEILTTDPKAAAVAYLSTVFKDETARSIKRALKWSGPKQP